MRGDPERRIAFRIALALGCTVDELYARMSFAEFQEWLVFLRDDPLPDPWLQTGVICATIANHAMNRSPNATPRQPRDFMPLPSPRPRTLSTAQLHSAFAPYRRDPSQSEPRPS